VFRADREYDNATWGCGALITISFVFRVKHRFYLGFVIESDWIDIKIRDGSNLLIGNHYFLPDTEVDFLRS
jgi:hypothetical protein